MKDDDAPARPPTLWEYMTRADRNMWGHDYSALRNAIAVAVGLTASVLGVGLSVILVIMIGRVLGAW